MLLDKGIVINADVAVSIGDTQLLGIQIRAAIASFETAAKYGLEFPEGTDMRRVAEAAGDPELAERERPAAPVDPTRGVNVTAEGDDEEDGDGEETETANDGGSYGHDGGTERGTEHVGVRPDPGTLGGTGTDLVSDTTKGDPEEWEPNEEDEEAGEGDADEAEADGAEDDPEAEDG
ncbi:gas vesicle protein GvpJ [Salinilacihabitans rarus]|uniref:gas vesicle protein n=1 Tax=Salinilacihabitans rarus TaxID=2961596 RepID=UPI0020C92E32